VTERVIATETRVVGMGHLAGKVGDIVKHAGVTYRVVSASPIRWREDSMIGLQDLELVLALPPEGTQHD
jgi:hypothetical protein